MPDVYDVPAKEWNEDELAREFVECYPGNRWVEVWHQWLHWQGGVWQRDDTLCVYDRIRDHLRGSTWIRKRHRDLLAARTVANVERLIRSDRRYAARADQWDQDSMLLNTKSGIVDLTTGELSDHNSECFMTKRTDAGVSGASCPRWLAFLDDVTEGDEALIAFLQRVVGYCLTGDTREHALFFLHGGGANGKSTFLSTIASIFGSYGIAAATDVFVQGRGDRHPTELAMLRGARLVTASETEEGRRWAESRIKQLTGGDPVTARFMRQDFFTFVPQFKLVIAGNHKPRLHNVDTAMRRRFHLIPFQASFVGKSCDQKIGEKLMQESEAILRWAIDGCLTWQRIGLQPPARVAEATEAYFANQDAFRTWLAECCETGPGFWEPPRMLYTAWREFADSAQYPVGTQIAFNDRMEAAGFCQRRKHRGRRWIGLRLKASPADDINSGRGGDNLQDTSILANDAKSLTIGEK